MPLVKLDAIDSTNDFLKALCTTQSVENYTVVTAQHQMKGKGQMGSYWISEKGKNLIMSVLIKDVFVDINRIYNLNVAISVAVVTLLESYKIPMLRIKWPNDIMSGNSKIGGILIENIIKSDGEIVSVCGLGLNVNQVNFKDLPNASSLKLITDVNYNTEIMVLEVVDAIKNNVQMPKFLSDELWTDYTNLLFKKGIPMPFEDNSENRFMGIILGVDKVGKLKVQLENDTIRTFNIKEIKMLY